MNLKDINAFLMISETHSLTQAARRLDTTPMTISRRLASLEKELGKRLLHRTTRAVALTDEGEEFLPYAKAMAEAERGALGLFSSEKKGAVGQLRITAPSGFGRRTIMPVLSELLDNNPDMNVELHLSDNVTDIVGLGFDVAIRIAPLRDSRLIAHKLSDNQRVLCASPEYLQRFGTPKCVADLTHHSCLRLTNVFQWTFIAANQPTSVTIDGRFSSSHIEGIRTLCKSGAGIAQLTEWDVREELRSGKLLLLQLEDVSPQNLAVWAVFPTTKYLPVRVTVFLEALKHQMYSQIQ